MSGLSFKLGDPQDPYSGRIEYSDEHVAFYWEPAQPTYILAEFSEQNGVLEEGFELSMDTPQEENGINIQDGMIGFFSKHAMTRIPATPENLRQLYEVLAQWYDHAQTL